MKKNTVFLLGLMVGLLMLTGCETASQKLSPMQKRQITTKMVDGSYNNVYASVMTILQDHGYVIKQTVKDTGLITANVSKDAGFWAKWASTTNGVSMNAGTKVEVSAVVDNLNTETSEVRLTIEEKQYNSMGGVVRSIQLYEPEVYQTLFNDIRTEVKRREAFGKN